MSNKIKINTIIISQDSNNIKNINNTVFPLKYKRQPEPKKTPTLDYSSNKNTTILNNKNENNTNESPKYLEENNNLNNTNKIKDLSKQNKKIFNIRKEKKNKWKRKKHDANSKDNIKQIIIRHFINFFVIFINLFVRKITKNKVITFKIGYKDKRRIKSGNILELNVEKMLLLFSPSKNKNNGKNDNKEKEPKYNYNQNQLIEIRNSIGSSLDILFKTRVINIFKDIYISKEKKIDLKKYGFEGIVLKLNKNIKAYEKLRRKYRGNKTKLKIMDNIIDTKFMNVKKFKIKKKEN